MWEYLTRLISGLDFRFLDSSGFDPLPLPNLPTEQLEMFDIGFLLESEASDEIGGGDPTVEVKGEIERLSSPSAAWTTTYVSSV